MTDAAKPGFPAMSIEQAHKLLVSAPASPLRARGARDPRREDQDLEERAAVAALPSSS
jgi:hypothetical protein